MKWKTLSITCLSVLLFLALQGCSDTANRIPVSIWQHSITLPEAEINQLGVIKDSLSVRFKDDSRITLSVIDYQESSFPQDLTPSEFVKAVYGEEEPDNPDFLPARKSMLEDAEEHEVIEIQEGINGYLFRSEARNTAYIADEKSERFFMIVEATDRSFDTVIESITRR
ncbi:MULTISPECIES: hypothetical protein [Halomonadaceae]|uniref:Lipoprotein n=1 Tax=Vreelandella halophila TaxID=86177 RepID=A0A9X5B480_9GAMM|nr:MULTISPECIES: hypothetical protein [Halomonas]MYL25168.1 hypothetical protein [Halomonas utahensis]MYL75230.1 hypothetical protein [Halomonas sp. 22501_18_FS]